MRVTCGRLTARPLANPDGSPGARERKIPPAWARCGLDGSKRMVTRKTPASKTGKSSEKTPSPARKAAAKTAAKAAAKTAAKAAAKTAKKTAAPKAATPKVAAKTTAAPVKKGAPKPAGKVAGKTAGAAVKKAATKPAPKNAPKAAAPRRGRLTDDDLDPARQLDKLDADPPAPPRARSRGPAAPRVQPVVAGLPDDFFAGFTGEPLSEAAMIAAAQDLGCEVAAIKAVAEVESRGSGFDAQGRPTVLYERQVFSRNCTPKGRFDSMPEISAPVGYGRGNYGNTESQWQKIAKAYALDPVAALKAPSWGTFQVLGENHKACGYADVREFVRLMITSPVGHLQVFVSFIRANPNLLRAIRALDWESFARGYNGKDFKTFGYDDKMRAAYARHAAAG